MDPHHTERSDHDLLAFHEKLARSLCAELPPPIDSTPGNRTASHTAVLALVRRLAPVDAAEALLASRYLVTRVHGVHCEHQAREHPPGSKPAMQLIAASARLAREATHIWSRLATVQNERRRRAAANVAALPTPPPHGEGPGGDSGLAAEATTGAAAARPVQPPLSPEKAKATPTLRWRPALRLIQGGLAC